MLLFLLISCEQEQIIDIGGQTSIEQQKYSKSKNTSKLTDEELIEKIEDLKKGVKRAYRKYNKKHPNKKFSKKYGKPKIIKVKYIQFAEDDNLVIIIPLKKKKNKKKKILVGYYKNGKKNYKVFTNKKYKRNNSESISEKNILKKMSIIFNKKLTRKTESQKSIQNKGTDGWIYLGLRYGGCVEEWYNEYSGLTWYQKNTVNPCPDEKGDDEINDEWDEPADPSIDEDTNDDDINDYCDGSDPDCEGGGGGSSDSGGSDDGNNNYTVKNSNINDICLDPTLGCTRSANILSSKLSLNNNQQNWLNNNLHYVEIIDSFLLTNNETNESIEYAKSVIDSIILNDYNELFELEIFNQSDPYRIWKNISEQEKELTKSYPYEAYNIYKNRVIANQATILKFDHNGLNDKSDAFRHSYYNAINTKIVGAFIAQLFSNAHESEVPNALVLEKEMDLFNNRIGHLAEINYPQLSISELANRIYQELQDGNLRYLNPLDFNSAPLYDANRDGIQDCSTCANGITNYTSLTPSNQ